MIDAEMMREVKALIRWYERRDKNWLMAAEFTLFQHHGGTISDLYPRFRMYRGAAMTESLKKGAIVVCKAMPRGPQGIVLRVASDGSWADMQWTGQITDDGPVETWTKRMRQEALVEVRR